MRDFLLDTNIWAYWFNSEGYPSESANIQKQIDSLISRESKEGGFAWRLAISDFVWGEIDYGYEVNRSKDASQEGDFRKFIADREPWSVPLNRHTARTYGWLRAALFESYGSEKKKQGLRPEQLIDPVSSKELRIQENDLWITAQAVTFNLTLVTNDKKMRWIHEIAGDSLSVENWAIGSQQGEVWQ